MESPSSLGYWLKCSGPSMAALFDHPKFGMQHLRLCKSQQGPPGGAQAETNAFNPHAHGNVRMGDTAS